MDQIKHHKIQTLTQFSQFYFPKIAIQVLLSVSIFSFLFSNSSLFPFLLHTFNTYAFATDRNYIFLLCNGILVFLIGNSGLISNSPWHADKMGSSVHGTTAIAESREGQMHATLHPQVERSSPPHADMKENQVKNNNGKSQRPLTESPDRKAIVIEEADMEVEEQGRENGILVIVGESENVDLIAENVDANEQAYQFHDIEEEDEEEEGIGLLSAEELNKRCDDFIKKMREEIRIQSKQLVMFQSL